MGRELRRKEAKKEGKSLKREEVKTINSWQKPMLTVGIVIIIFVFLYLILAIFVTKEIDFSGSKDNSSTNTEAASSVANAILANSIFKQSEDIYYVYFFDFSDQDTNVSNTISNNLIDEKIYRVNTADSMNSNYVSEEGNRNSSSLDDLLVSNPTLIKIESGKITMFLEGSTEIVDYYGN